MWNNEFKQRSAGLSEWLLICQFTVTAGRDKSTVGMWSVFRGFQLRVWPDSQRAFIQLSLQTPKLPEHRSIFSLMHTVPQSIWPIADFLVFAHLSHFNVSDHNKTKGLIPKHLTSWQDNRWAFWTVCVIRRTSYQQSHMLALVRLVRGCFAALQYLRIRWNREFCSQAESPEGQTMIQNTLPSPARDNEGPKSDWDA